MSIPAQVHPKMKSIHQLSLNERLHHPRRRNVTSTPIRPDSSYEAYVKRATAAGVEPMTVQLWELTFNEDGRFYLR